MVAESDFTYYPNLRRTLDPAYTRLSDAELEALFESAFGEGVTPAEYEEFFNGLGRALSSFGQKAAPVFSSVASGALQGASAGSALGPYGMLAGALMGGAGGGLKHAGGPAKDVGGVLSGIVGTAGSLTGGGGLGGMLGGLGGRGGAAGMAGGGMGGGGMGSLMGMGAQALGQRSPATAQLLSVLGRPETRQALAALLGGGNQSVPVGRGGVPVPASAFAGLLGALGREAEAESFEWQGGESVPGYLVGPNGQLVVDPNDAQQRAARLLALLHGASRQEQEAWLVDSIAGEAAYEAADAEAYYFGADAESVYGTGDWVELDGAYPTWTT